MPISVMSTGTPEVANEVRKLADELLYAMGAILNLERLAQAKPDLVVLSIFAIAPERGTIPNGTRFSRVDREFTSSHNIDFHRFVDGDLATKLEAVGQALIDALNQVPETRANKSDKAAFANALPAAILKLTNEPDRLAYRQR